MLRRLLLLLSAASAAVAGYVWLRPLDAGPHGTLPPAEHEKRDVRFGPMVVAGVLMLLGLLGTAGVAALIFPAARHERVVALPQAPFPVPQLQPNPEADMAAFRKRQLEQLNSFWWIDRGAGRVHLPIEQAMRDVAQRGIPDWPQK